MKPIFPVLIAVFLMCAPYLSRAEVTDRIVAVVNDEIVTLREVQRLVTVEKKSPYVSMNEYARDLQLREKLDVFIEGLLISQQAKKLNIEATDKEVQESVDNIKKQNLITDVELRQQLKKDNIDYNEFFDGIKRSIIRSKVLGRAVMQEVDLDEKDLETYYNAHKSDYVQEEYGLQHIFVSSQRNDAADRARQALRALEQEKPFEEVAKEFSDDASNISGGDMGFVPKEELIPELKEAVKLLIPGTYSTIVRTAFGYHILKLNETRKGQAGSFESVKGSIRAKLFQIESEKRYKSYIAKLRVSSYIEVKI